MLLDFETSSGNSKLAKLKLKKGSIELPTLIQNQGNWVIGDSKTTFSMNNPQPSIEELRAGKNFIETKVYTAEEDEEILKLFEDLRVADVSDGMDKAGLTNVGLMLSEIHPLWKDTENYTHRFIGIAVTI